MKRILTLLFILPLLCFFAVAQTISTGNNPHIDYARLMKIDSLVSQYIRKGWVKDVVTIVVKDNQLVQYKGYGYFDPSGKKPMPKDALFRLASQTKAVVSVAARTLD